MLWFLLAAPRLLIIMALPNSAMFPGHWGNCIFEFVSFGPHEPY